MDKQFTRREFLKTAGKGLSMLALFSGVIRIDTPARAEGEEPLFVNDLIHGEDQLKVTFLEIRDEEKSDAFFITYLSEKGLDIILIKMGLSKQMMGLATFSDAFTFALLIIILIVKPTGLFGEKTTDKV